MQPESNSTHQVVVSLALTRTHTHTHAHTHTHTHAHTHPLFCRYPNAEVVWCQEEPKNMGAWFYVRPRLMTALKEHCSARVRGVTSGGGCGKGEASRDTRMHTQTYRHTGIRADMSSHTHNQTPKQPKGLEMPVPRYIGRPVSAPTATASFEIHKQEEQKFLEEAMTLE